MEKKDWVGLGFVIFLFLMFFAIYAFYSDLTGKVITLEPGEAFNTKPIPENPPEIFPDVPREVFQSPPVDIECNTAINERKAFCSAFVERFGERCGFFEIFSGCRLLRELCVEAQERVDEVCSLEE